MEANAFAAAVHSSGGAPPQEEELDRVLGKIAVLEQTGRYAGLLGPLAAANDKSNFLSMLLEVTFAHQWESQGLQLAREVRQSPELATTVDFRRVYAAGNLDMELRLIQQDAATTEQIRAQLAAGPFFGAAMGVEAQLATIHRAQNIILSKIQRADGTPVKYAPPQAGTTNIVVVDTHDLFLGHIDVDDCRMIVQGDPAVQEEYRLGAFGMFQAYQVEYGQGIKAIHDRFIHASATVHGIMFLFRAPGSCVFDFGLQQLTFWNPGLMDVAKGTIAMAEIQRAIPFHGI